MDNSERIQSLIEDLDHISINHPDIPFYVECVLQDDIPWMINYINKVENFLKLIDNSSNQAETVTFMGGYMSALKDLKASLNEVNSD